MHWQEDLPFVQGRRFISDPRQGHFFLDLLNAEQKMELDPKPDEYLIANAHAQRHVQFFPHRRHARTCSQDAVLCFQKASIFSVCHGPAFAELDYVVCFPDEILIRGLSHTKCWPALGKNLHAVSRMGWVLTRGKHGASQCCRKERDHAGVQEESTHQKQKRFLTMGWIPRVSFKKVFQTQAKIQQLSGGNEFCMAAKCQSEGLHHWFSMCGWTGSRWRKELGWDLQPGETKPAGTLATPDSCLVQDQRCWLV